MKQVNTYHVYLGGRRTTASLDKTLSALISLKHNAQPETEEAHTEVRKYLQAKLDEGKDPGRVLVSQWLQDEVIFDLVDKKLSEKYLDWHTQSNSPQKPRRRSKK